MHLLHAYSLETRDGIANTTLVPLRATGLRRHDESEPAIAARPPRGNRSQQSFHSRVPVAPSRLSEQAAGDLHPRVLTQGAVVNKSTKYFIVAALTASLSLEGLAQSRPIAYPARGQSQQQQQQDEGACYSWARSNTGVDPTAVANAPPPPSGPAVGGGERVQGAARGAAGGAVIGAIAGDAGKGAAIGAATGTMVGGSRARQNRRAAAAQSQTQTQGSMDTFNRAFAACMSGRGYTVQ
ncbi:hypothetical protein OKW43_000758 [Paraburkholderia sp. WC7.3g]